MEASLRLYYLTSEKWGIENLQKRRLKISRFDDLNDPFELLSANLGEKRTRAFHKQLQKSVANKWGLLCFSQTWQSPVMWAHYADKHRGLCLGFDVLEARKVLYTPDRLVHELQGRDPNVDFSAHEKLVTAALTTKYKEWEYEQECRVFARLDEPAEGNHYFKRFEDGGWLYLREVIIGARSKLTPAQIREVVGRQNSKAIRIFKARGGFTRYEVVHDKRSAPITVRPRVKA